MRTSVLTAILSLFIFIASCASTNKPPEWINGNSSKYKSSRYIVGIGQADSQAMARDRARADLAKNFQVNILEVSEEELTESSQNQGDIASTQFESEISRNLITRTEQIIEGVRIAESWEDPKTKTFYSFAVLDRLQAGGKLRQIVSGLDESTRIYLEQARTTDDLIGKIGKATKALLAQKERERYQRYLAVIDSTGIGVTSPYNVPSLQADWEELLKRLKISPLIIGDPFGGLDKIVSGALSNAGFLHENKQETEYILAVGLKVVEHPDNAGWNWVRGTLEVLLKESDRVRGSKRWEIKVSSKEPRIAKKRAMDQVDEVLKKELRDAIIGFAGPEEGASGKHMITPTGE